MPICTRRGCGEEQSSSKRCRFHPGSPVFHEGLKSWSCCEKVNKPVMEFDQFLAIPGCQEAEDGKHSDVKQQVKAEVGNGQAAPPAQPSVSVDADGREVYGAQPGADAATESVTQTMSAATLNARKAGAAAAEPKKEEEEEEEDPAEADDKLAEGTACKRSGCGAKFQGGKRERSKEECRHHSGVAVFHEGSKGYTCCKRRVLDFADFLQIEPCTTSSKGHLFVGAAKKKAEAAGSADEESVECRLDWYETPADVRVTVYAKAVEEDKSGVEFKGDEVHLNLVMSPLPSSATGLKRKHARVLQTFAALDPSASSFRISKMKVELVLVKAAKGQSWPVLERTERVFGYGSTFGRHQ